MGKWVVKGTRTYYGEGNTWGRTLYNSEEPSAVGEKWLIFCVVPCCAVLSRSVVFDSLWPHGLWPARLLWPWDFPGKNTGVGCHTLLQGIFPTQGWNPCLPHCRWILYHLSHQGEPKNTGVGSLSLLQGNFPTQESKPGLLHCRRILYGWATREPPCV